MTTLEEIVIDTGGDPYGSGEKWAYSSTRREYVSVTAGYHETIKYDDARGGNEHKTTLREYHATKARLQNKPGWDSHKWPAIVQNGFGWWMGTNATTKDQLTGLFTGACQHLNQGVLVGDWRDTLEVRPESDVKVGPMVFYTETGKRISKEEESVGDLHVTTSPSRRMDNSDFPETVVWNGEVHTICRVTDVADTKPPEEKTMKTVSDAVRELNGVWPIEPVANADGSYGKWCGSQYGDNAPLYNAGAVICRRTEFEAEAERLGYRSKEWMPAIGAECEVAYTPQIDRWWPKAQLICVDNGYAFFKREGKNKPLIRTLTDVKFRPLQSERERWVAEAMKQCRTLSKHDCEAIYDAGLGRLPECKN